MQYNIITEKSAQICRKRIFKQRKMYNKLNDKIHRRNSISVFNSLEKQQNIGTVFLRRLGVKMPEWLTTPSANITRYEGI